VHNKIKRHCPVCGRIYNADSARLKFGRQTSCSRACSYKLRATALQRRKEYKCSTCGKGFLRSPSQIKSRHALVFCSSRCAYARRERVVSRPYVRVAIIDYAAAAQKAWKTRRRYPKPYPETARKKAAARCIERLKHGGQISLFEKEAGDVFERLGFRISRAVPVRRPDGTFAHVFDIVIGVRRLAVECHGTYFHVGRWSWCNPTSTQIKNLLYEERKLVMARARGLDLRLLWEHEFRKDPAGACLAVVR
jgi:hypothetical protein